MQGLKTLREALVRVGMETFPAQSEDDYNAGKTTQVPTGRVVAGARRIRRKIGYDWIRLTFERVTRPGRPRKPARHSSRFATVSCGGPTRLFANCRVFA